MPAQFGTVLENAIAAGSVTGATGAAVVARGAATARTGAGIYTITLDQACDSTECVLFFTSRTAAVVDFSYAHTSDTVKTLTTQTEAGVDTDADFDFIVVRISGGTGR